MDASLFDLVAAYYQKMTVPDIQKNGARYLESVWPVFGDIKLRLLFIALQKLKDEAQHAAVLRKMHLRAQKEAMDKMPQIIAQTAKGYKMTPEKVLEICIECNFRRLKNKSDYVFGHFINDCAWERIPAADFTEDALQRVKLLMNGCQKQIKLPPQFLGRMVVLCANRGYHRAIPVFMNALQQNYPDKTRRILMDSGLNQTHLNALMKGARLTAHPKKRNLKTCLERASGWER